LVIGRPQSDRLTIDGNHGSLRVVYGDLEAAGRTDRAGASNGRHSHREERTRRMVTGDRAAARSRGSLVFHNRAALIRVIWHANVGWTGENAIRLELKGAKSVPSLVGAFTTPGSSNVRGLPRWSNVAPAATPASIAGLPGKSFIVRVGPPLSASAA